MSGKGLFLSVLIFLVATGCNSNSFPTIKEIDELFVQYPTETTESKKTVLIGDLLKTLSRPRSVEDDKVVRYAIGMLVKEYERTEDEAILVAVDGTRIEGGFANFICGFYNELKKNKKFIQRYQHNPQAMKAIERCIGITFSEADLKEIKGPPR
jgi:branched-subunit amino acid aminotransferase/4-amino-4-deoxychorismate lyase